jgi:hypothetical protein
VLDFSLYSLVNKVYGRCTVVALTALPGKDRASHRGTLCEDSARVQDP